jgi:hypothetical protein
VRAQVDRDLTTVDYFDRLLGLIKNLGHHSCVSYLDSLPFQEGALLALAEEHTPTEVATSDSSLGSPDRQVFMTTNETLGPSVTLPDRYLKDISPDELSANAPADETDANRDA